MEVIGYHNCIADNRQIGGKLNFIIKHFNDLSTTELYEILKTRAEILVVEQDYVYQDLDDKDQDRVYYRLC